MGIMKKFMNGKYYDVYCKDKLPEHYSETGSNTAILDSKDVVLPIRKGNEKGPGYYDTGISSNGVSLMIRIPPTDKEIESVYNTRENFINFDNTDSITQYMINVDKERRLTENIISNVENEYQPVSKPTDDPFMKLVKEAIRQKHFDISKYKDVFGTNFNNDKRSLESRSITLNKAIEILTKLGIEIFIGLKNVDDNVPNPMRNEVYGIVNSPDFEVCTGPIRYDQIVMQQPEYDENDNEDWDEEGEEE